MSVTEYFLVLSSYCFNILYRCWILVIYTTEGVIFGVISRVETIVIAPSAEHDGSLCFAASTFGWGSVRIACSISSVVYNTIN